MYEKLTLENGVRIVYEHIPYVRSAAVGIWVGNGSRHEIGGENGASHFIEHMIFKGTKTRTAAEIAALMDGIGGQANAFTSKDCTCYYTRALDSHLDLALDVLCDMFFESKFDETDVQSERGVILEEIDMYEDAPEDLVSERLNAVIFKGSPLGKPILGTPKTLGNMTGESLVTYMNKNYSPDRVVVALSGSFTERDIAYLKDRFSQMPPREVNAAKPAVYQPGFTVKKKSIEQNHLCMAFPGLVQNHPDRYALQLMSGILGGGMSSRLFQTLREEMGLCYSVYSFHSGFDDTGMLGIYTALSKDTEEKALEAMVAEIQKFRNEGISEAELVRTREQMKSNVLMSLESTNARMNRLGKGELIRGEVIDTDAIIRAYDSVTAAQIQNLAQTLLDVEQMALSAVGRVQPVERYRELFSATLAHG